MAKKTTTTQHKAPSPQSGNTAVFEEVKRLVGAAKNGDLSERAKVDQFDGQDKVMLENINEMLDTVIGPLNVAAEYVDRISKGDIPEKITDEYKGDFNEVKNNLNQCIDALNLMVGDTDGLIQAAIEGKLDARADAEKHQGDFRKIVGGINQTLDAVIGPLNVAAEYIDRISKGDVPEKITDEYKGDFNEIKNNINQCTDALNLLVSDTNGLIQAAIEGKLDARADAEKHQGDFRKIVGGINQTLDAVIGPLNVAAEYIDRISKGDLPEKITDEYKGDFNEIKNNINQCTDALNLLVSDTNGLIQAAIEGKLDARADAEKHQGDFRKIVGGINQTLDAVIGPLNVAAEYIDRISKGDLPEKITDEYKGDFNEIKNNINQCTDALNLLVSDTNGLIQAAIEGKLDARADAEKHQGDFRKIVGGINQTLDAVIGPLNVAAEYIDRISKGDLPEKITDEYKGDFNEIKNNINQCTDALNLLVSDTNGLIQAAIEGKLDARADAEKHQGDFRKIVGGINRTLDAVIGPLNVAAEYIDRISKGDMPEKITDEYKGDFNEIKNNINICSDALNLLVSDTNGLIEAAIEGKLDARADAEKHQGDFRKIVGGINRTLDAVIGPLNVAAEYIDRISKGDVPEKITDEYKGDFNEIKNNINICSDALNLLVSDTNGLIEAAIEGKLDARADAEKHQGDFRKIVGGINQTLDAVIGPLNVAAEYIDRISKGDLPEKITDEYKGDFNEIKNNINQCTDALNLLVSDTNGLIEAAIEGKLDARADAEKHQGDFRKIVGGINQTLDAVIGPLNVAAEYIDRISKGDIPEKITDEYKGDFNEIKNNINICSDALNLLLSDANGLVEAAVKGKLDVRADAEKHQGDFRKLVSGINGLVDAVVGPLNVAAEYVDRISKGDIPEPITDEYKGDFNEIKNNLNQCCDALKGIILEDGGAALNAAAQKNITKRVERSYDGNFNVMKKNINNMLDAFDEALNQVGESVEQVGSASGQVSSSSQSLAEGATEQAAGLEETSSSLEEMASMTKQNADNAQQANTLSDEAKKAANNGNEAMGRMNVAVNEIQKSSDETSKIIKVIDEIAFQTNLLALNAAVEAARAGEAGKGFAVVAEEVRNLAMRSAEAAKNTSAMIEESVKNCKNGVDIAGEVDKVLNEIAESIGKTSDLVGEIAAASQEQSQGIDQVNTAMAQMDKVTQQNAANAEESASASEELSAQAESLQDMVQEFTLSSSGGKGSGHRQDVKVDQNAARHHGLGQSDKALHQIAEPRAQKAKPKKVAARVEAEKAIPLNEESSGGNDDFKEFNS